MHEGDHSILDDEHDHGHPHRKGRHAHPHDDSHDHQHPHPHDHSHDHSHEETPEGAGRAELFGPRTLAALIVAAAVVSFVVWRFL